MNIYYKKTIISVFLTIFFFSSAYADEFCDGFEKGYITGYKQASGSSLEPLTPMCPMQPMKRLNDPDSDYEHGYIIGLSKGMQNGS